jgi:hypothetical protein
MTCADRCAGGGQNGRAPELMSMYERNAYAMILLW